MLRLIPMLAIPGLAGAVFTALAIIWVPSLSAGAEGKRSDPFVQAERELDEAHNAARRDRADRIEQLEQRRHQHQFVSPLADDDEAKDTVEENLD